MAEHLLARVDMLMARLDEQAATVAAQAKEIARLRSLAEAPRRVSTGSEEKRSTTRRGLLKGALAAGAAVTALAVAKAPPAQALDPNDIVRNGVTVTDTGAHLISPSPTFLLNYVFSAENFTNTSLGIPSTARIGLIGMVSGQDTTTLQRIGVLGAVDGAGANSAVLGLTANAIGVGGQSNTGMGVYGTSPSTGFGVYGRSTNGIGVYGTSPSFYGVHGNSPSGAGVFGLSDTGFGVYGYSSGVGGRAVGLYGVANSGEGLVGLTQTGIGVHGNATSGGLAARFDGPTVVNGSFTVVGGAKSAAVPHADGDFRRVYCQESPEPWFEDFGTATLANGRAEVALDPEFEAVVKGDDYLVFLTPVGVDCSLYVSRKGPHRFEVRSVGGSARDGTFDYRVVSRRKDAVGKRLERIRAADINKGKDIPKPLEPKPIPDIKFDFESPRPQPVPPERRR